MNKEGERESMNAAIQLAVVGIYMVLTIALGVLSRRSAQNYRDFMGANIGVLLCVVAGAGEWTGGTATTGVSEYGFTYGMSGAWYTMANGLGIIFLALFFAKLYRSLGKITVSGIIGKYLGARAGMVSAVLVMIVMLVLGAAPLVAIGTLGQTLLGLPASASIILLGTGVILYTILGGMVAVGYTNILHMLTMYIGMGAALIAALSNVGGMEVLQSKLEPAYFNFMTIGGSKVTSWIIASILGACTAQAGIQPILAAKDEKTAVKASFWIALLVAPFGLLTALLGMIAKVKFPELADAKLALPQLMLSMHPVVGGMVLAAILAAVLSTASPILLASSTLFTKDVYQHFCKDASDRNILWVSRISTLLSGIVCIVIAIALYDSTMLLDIVYFAYSMRGSIFVILAMGIYWKRTTSDGAVVGMLMSAVVGVFWVVYNRLTGVYPIHPGFSETYASILSALFFTITFSWLRRSRKGWG